MNTQTPKAYSYIRFSTPEQKEGDSERRQIKAAEEYAKEHGLELDTSMRDKGLSAYHGTHRSKGKLGKFLKLVEAGKIAKGSMLIIENFDRLSREDPDEVLTLFLSIIRSGIILVTLSDERKFTPDSINENIGDLYIAIGEIYRAHKESERKSEMLSNAWEDKRRKARNGGKKLSAMCPKWLKPIKDDDGNTIEFEVIPKRAEAIQEMFKLKKGGYGNTKIAKRLNKNDDIWQPPKSNRSSGGWRESYIQKIVHNKAVIGQYQPHKKIDGKREPVGDPIKDYYPPVVDEDLFRAVHNRLKRFRKKNGHPGGRTGKAKNLFSHIIKCGKCESSMHFIDKGEQQYLRCDTSRRVLKDEETDKRICDAKAIPYHYFKDRFFEFVQELNISALLPNPDEYQNQINNLQQKKQANVNRIEELNEQEKNLRLQISRTDNPDVSDSLGKELGKAIASRKELKKENNLLLEQLQDVTKEAEKMRDSRNNIQEFNQLYETAQTEEERKNLRVKMREEIRSLVSRIQVYQSNGTSGSFDQVIIWFSESEPFARLISLKEDGWEIITRKKVPKK